MTSQDLPREPGDLHFALIQLMARERVTSLRREAERSRLVREASMRSPQHPARAPGRGARALRGRRLTGGGAVWLGRVWRSLSRSSAGADCRP